MLAQARVQGPHLTAGTANLIMQACLPQFLISCCSLRRSRLPDANHLGPGHYPTLGLGLGMSQGSGKQSAVKQRRAPHLHPDVCEGI